MIRVVTLVGAIGFATALLAQGAPDERHNDAAGGAEQAAADRDAGESGAAAADRDSDANAGAGIARIKTIDVTDSPPDAQPACFNVRDARGFDALSNEFVYVRGRGDEHYLLTMAIGCPDLRGAFRIAISNQLNRVCSSDYATIIYEAFGRPASCRIRRVEAVGDKDAAKTIVELRGAR